MRAVRYATCLLMIFAATESVKTSVNAQPPAPMAAGNYSQDYTVGNSNGSGWVDNPAKTVVPRWQGMPRMNYGPQAGTQSPYFRDTELGDQPHFGHNGSPGAGYPHHDNRMPMYGIWYRPEGYAGTAHWNQPLSFNPMGKGVPQHRSAYRLDYAPYPIQTAATQYGPHYYPRFRDMNDPRSEDCDKPEYCRKKTFWLFGRKADD